MNSNYSTVFVIAAIILGCHCLEIVTLSSTDQRPRSGNDIPVFPGATSHLRTRDANNTATTTITPRPIRHSGHYFGENDPKIHMYKTDEGSRSGRMDKHTRLLNFLRNFKLDFSKFDSTCLKRGGRGVAAPVVANAHILKYTRRRKLLHSGARYGMVLYECDAGYAFPDESADRMFCSKNKWVGPTPVCLPKGMDHDEQECRKCDQICTADKDREPRVTCSCYAGFQMSTNGSCVDVDECAVDNGGCSGICYNKPGSFQCFCPTGYQVGPDGKNCIDRNECLLRNGHGPCQDTCQNTAGSYVCNCKGMPGTRLSGDKHSCEDVNECEQENNYGCSHMCLNTFGKAICACPQGYTLSNVDYKTCISDDTAEEKEEEIKDAYHQPQLENLLDASTSGAVECPPGSEPDSDNPKICVEHEDCSLDNGGCEHVCVPSGAYRFCSCRPGYELMNETSCLDVNECEIDNGGCEHMCVNIPGGFFCTCKEGFALADDNKTCKAKYCDEPPILPNSAGWDCEGPDGHSVQRGHLPKRGTRCKIRCKAGFALKPSYDLGFGRFGKIHCSSEGLWSPMEAFTKTPCIPASCPKLTAPKEGSLFPDACQSESVPLNTQCLVLCSSGYYPKSGRIRTCSKGYRWFPEDNPVCIKVPHTPRPYIHCPSDVTVDLKPNQASAYVKIPQPQANMDWYRYVEAEPPWAKNLEWDVPAGVTQVVFTARSPLSNDTATCQFKIHVQDREAPRVQGCPSSFEIRLSGDERSKEVWWSEPKFSDNVKLEYVQQSHSPGQALPRGTHHISYIAADFEGNQVRCSFNVIVHGVDDMEMADYTFYNHHHQNRLNRRQDHHHHPQQQSMETSPTSPSSYGHMIICPNTKTGRWTFHYAYYLPPGCRYHTQGLFSNLFKQHTYRNYLARQRRRILNSRTLSPTMSSQVH